MKNLINFRGFSDIKSKDGKKIRPLIFRSGYLESLNDEDINYLINQNIKNIIDFRSKGEIEREISTKIPNSIVIELDVLADSLMNYSSLENINKSKNQYEANNHMNQIYKDMVLKPSAILSYKNFFRHLIDSEGGTLFHCFAGKDRTGFAAFLFLKILDVDDEHIFDDYLKTKKEREKANNIILDKHKQDGILSKEEIEAIEILLSVEKSYLEIAIDSIKESYIDFENYTQKALELSKDDIKKLREKYLYE